MFLVSILLRHAPSPQIRLVRVMIVQRVLLHLEVEMKRLNEKKKFATALALFDRHKQKQNSTDRIIVQAFKACTQLGDLERGRNIHKTLLNTSLSDVYIQSALIHFYSRSIVCFASNHRYKRGILVQCGCTSDAQRIYDSSKRQTLPHYAAMMKGECRRV
jgi:hypothetical protein